MLYHAELGRHRQPLRPKRFNPCEKAGQTPEIVCSPPPPHNPAVDCHTTSTRRAIPPPGKTARRTAPDVSAATRLSVRAVMPRITVQVRSRPYRASRPSAAGVAFARHAHLPPPLPHPTDPDGFLGWHQPAVPAKEMGTRHTARHLFEPYPSRFRTRSDPRLLWRGPIFRLFPVSCRSPPVCAHDLAFATGPHIHPSPPPPTSPPPDSTRHPGSPEPRQIKIKGVPDTCMLHTVR